MKEGVLQNLTDKEFVIFLQMRFVRIFFFGVRLDQNFATTLLFKQSAQALAALVQRQVSDILKLSSNPTKPKYNLEYNVFYRRSTLFCNLTLTKVNLEKVPSKHCFGLNKNDF